MDKLDVTLFLKEIAEVCKKYNMSISHEDGQGGFIIEKYDPHYVEWLTYAAYENSKGESERLQDE